MLSDVVGCLQCPHCTTGLALDGRVLRCEQGHAFDVARQGYVNLLAGQPVPGGGDDAAMVAARERFLAAGHLPVRDLVATEAERVTGGALASGCVVDLGAGTGHYLAHVLDRLGGSAVGLALDASTYAARRAARAHQRAGSVVCDVWRRLPVHDAVAPLVLDVFAPRNASEIARILAPGGTLIVVTPGERHLHELVDALGLLTVDPDKERRLETSLTPYLRLERAVPHTSSMTLGHDDVLALVGMGPSARHVDPSALAGRVARMPGRAQVTASVLLSTYRKG